MDVSVGFLGAGNMAEALIRGFLETRLCSPDRVWATDVAPQRLAWMAKTYGLQAAPDAAALLRECPVLILAVKPQQAMGLLADLRPRLQPAQHCLLSIAAGLTTSYLEKQTQGRGKNRAPDAQHAGQASQRRHGFLSGEKCRRPGTGIGEKTFLGRGHGRGSGRIPDECRDGLVRFARRTFSGFANSSTPPVNPWGFRLPKPSSFQSRPCWARPACFLKAGKKPVNCARP